jgi:cytochrome c oxidase subunit 2
MNIDLYEKIWLWCATGVIVLFIGLTGFSTFAIGIRPPSHVETIDPRQVLGDPRFQAPGVATDADGRITVTLVGGMFFWLPREITVPAGRPVTFRLTALDVVHGFEVAKTNINTMVVPGYVSQLTYTFTTPGEYLVVCNEFCGTGHHTMGGKIIVEAAP